MGKKLDNNKSGAAKAHKAQLSADAAQRQAARDDRTNEQQIMALDTRPGLAKKERAKLS